MQLEEFPLEDQIKGTVSSMSSDNVVTLVYKPSGSFEGLDIYASYNEVFLKKYDFRVIQNYCDTDILTC